MNEFSPSPLLASKLSFFDTFYSKVYLTFTYINRRYHLAVKSLTSHGTYTKLEQYHTNSQFQTFNSTKLNNHARELSSPS